MDLLLVSLLRQLASKCQGFPDSRSLKWFRDHQDTGELPDDTNELLKHLKLFISTVDKDIFIVLDGLDQVPERQRTAKSGPLKLLDIIRKLARKGYPNLHILLASRDEKDIKSCLETNMEDMLVPVNVKQGLGEELNMFVERKLEDMRILNGSQSLKQAVRKRLNLGQDSNFLWAASVLNQVSQSRDAEEIRDVLNKVPDNVVGMYQAALEKVAVKDTKRMKLILLWMLRQQRPLSQAELAAAVGLHSPSAVTEICTRVLIQTSQQSIVVAGGSQVLDVFRFSHFSVQEYLEAVFAGSQEKLGTKLEKVARFIFPLQEDAHIQLTRRCLAILSPCISSQKNKTAAAERGPGSDSDTGHGDVTAANSDAEDTDFDDSRTDARTTSSTTGSKWIEGPARRYASKYWFRHYNMVDRKKASSCEVKDLDSEVCLQFLLDDEKLRFWLKIHNPDGEKDDNVPSPVYYAIKLKLDGILEQLIAQLGRSQNDTVDRKAILDRRGSEGTALQLAAHLGNSDALNALIEHGADVNSEKGPHGTALYASAARGDENAVRKLLDASANCTGTEDGPLGSPLHVAAFRGHDAVIQLLLDCDRVAVDHRAGPFCTALQASCASRQRTTVKLLLDHGADPNIVGGRLGTAAQAALTHPGRSGHKIVETLLDKKAEFLTEPSFWRTAYEIGVFRDSDQGCNIRMGQELPSEGSYQRLLLRYGMPTSPGIDELQEPQQQHLLSAVIHQWTLPRIIHLNSDYLFGDLLCRVPFQDQLDAIKQATPRLELTMQHLRHEDFLYQAMFWSGINYILNRLPSLIRQCLGQVRRLLRREFEESAQVSTSPLFPFRWAIKDFEAGYFRYDEDAWPRRSLVSGFPIRHQPDRWRSPWGEQDGPGPMGSWSRSDLIAMELMQRRRRYKNLEEVDLLPSNDVDRGDSAARKELRLASRPGVWVTSDILDLVKDLLVYSDRCVRYQESVSDKAEGVARKHRNHIVDLTSELFSTIIRLSLVLDGHTDVDDLEQLVDPVRLLTTVRLERIKRFDAICEKDFVPKSTCSHASTENNSESKAQEIAAAVARQVEQTIEDKLAASQADMVREIQSHVSSAVKEEVSRLVEQMQQGLEEKMYEMQRRLAEGQATQAKRGLLWTPRGRSSG
ncbi:hypothetical protein B0I37DRAFT_135597 [Chaetomium sp. MPI-CAGE-AT-0009]|nr:hypothetical protein B0I37DRAFT_135597 [Chaetomium sp. MPI-CAGE-AT-0009]